MQELFDFARDRLTADPASVLGLLVSAAFAFHFGCRALAAVAYGTWRAARWAWAERPPGELAAAVLHALDGEVLASKDWVAAGNVSVWPERATNCVTVSGDAVDRHLTDAERIRIRARARDLRTEHQEKQRKAEVASLLAKVKKV